MTTTRTTPIVPVIHGNGSSKQDLMERRSKAWDALDTAYQALKATGPNSRDYNGGEHYEQACEQHQRRLKMLDDILDDLGCEMDAIEAQGK